MTPQVHLSIKELSPQEASFQFAALGNTVRRPKENKSKLKLYPGTVHSNNYRR